MQSGGGSRGRQFMDGGSKMSTVSGGGGINPSKLVNAKVVSVSLKTPDVMSVVK